MADRITVALYPHRPEALDRAARLMQGHDAVILEEPETPGFADMLSGRLEVDEYLLGVDFEYPVLARRTCDLARRLFGQGKAVLQVDPFMDRLMAVHELLGSGAGPGDVLADPDLAPVYRAERAWTRTLVDFYKKSIGPSFSKAVAAVIEFAGADAARGRLRDALRASSLARLAPGLGAAFVEAGYIHLYLLRELKRVLGPGIGLVCALPLG
ncbi:MAG: hypothetical protein PHV85_06105, partial [Desulfovibrionaceae bacterium]|nr:hypothetical protein [Desulfovibrionaceae bacterium]